MSGLMPVVTAFHFQESFRRPLSDTCEITLLRETNVVDEFQLQFADEL